MDPLTLLGTALGFGFAAGLRLYATVLAIGLAVRYDWVTLPATLKPLEMLGHPVVIGVAAVMFIAEFISDKIPWFDSMWDAVHTFIRPIGAAVLGLAAFSEIDPLLRTVLVLVCGGVALTSHASKAATRVAVNQSPEPFSNWALSLTGDVAVPGLVWLTMAHPLVVAALVGIALLVAVWLFRRMLRLVRSGFAALGRAFA